LVAHNAKSKIVKVHPYGSEEQWRFERVLEILIEADKRYLEKLLNKEEEQQEQVSQILDESDKNIIRKAEKRRTKRYNLTQTAKILGTTRQGLYYWIKKSWVKPRRDYRNYPVFTVFDIQEIIKWRDTIK
jgi:DNA-binding phage protein